MKTDEEGIISIIREDKESQLLYYVNNMNIKIPYGTKRMPYKHTIKLFVDNNKKLLNRYSKNYHNYNDKRIKVSENELLYDIVNLYLLYKIKEIDYEKSKEEHEILIKKYNQNINTKDNNIKKELDILRKSNEELVTNNNNLNQSFVWVSFILLFVNIFWFVYLLLGPNKLISDIKDFFSLFRKTIDHITIGIIMTYKYLSNFDYSIFNYDYFLGFLIILSAIYITHRIIKKFKKD